jgi:hypothetical protein
MAERAEPKMVISSLWLQIAVITFLILLGFTLVYVRTVLRDERK